MGDVTSLCSGLELPTNEAPSVIQLLPSGVIRGRDGRAFRLADAQAVIAASTRDGLDLAIDYEHQADDPIRQKNGPVPAAGWIKGLHAREDGIWGEVEWTATASQMLKDREYRYLSPVIVHNGPEAGNVVQRIKGASLVHRPNFELQALASEEKNHMPNQPSELATIAEAMGLSADATLQDVLNAVAKDGKPDPAKYVPIEAVADLLKNRNQSIATMSQLEVEAKVETAMNRGHICPAMRDWATDLCSQSPDSFDAFVSSAAPMFGETVNPPTRDWTTPPVPRQTGDVTALCDQLGLAPEQLK